MTILVDAAIWPWRGRHWAHLISDVSYDELHEFAVSIGVRRIGFQGDHYDIDSETRVIALKRGAVDADSRQIVRRLRTSGLRVLPGQKPPTWQLITKRTTVDDHASLKAALPPDVFGSATYRFANTLTINLMRIGTVEASLVRRPVEAALILSVSGPSSDLQLEVASLLARSAAPNRAAVYVSGYGDIVIEVLETQDPTKAGGWLETRPAVSSHH